MPFYPVEVHDLGTGNEIRNAILAWLVAVEALVHMKRSGHLLIRPEAKWATAGDLRYRFEWIGRCQLLRHHRTHVDAELAEGIRQQGKWPIQPKDNCSIV